MRRFSRRYGLWIGYALFLVLAVAYGGREGLVTTESGFGGAKLVVLAVYLGFLAFSLYATARENFFRSVGQINRLWWGRQIGLDLYISVFASLGLIWLVEGSLGVMLIWTVPVLIFANLAILPYLLLNFGAILGAFAG